MKRICVYCGSSPGKNENFSLQAKQLGKCLADANIELVYGGASVGLMGSVADAVMSHGGKVIGVIPKALVRKEVCHEHLTELQIVDSMHDRKAAMAELSDGFIALPGGLGTLEELFEILTWGQLGFHNKPCGLINVDGYYDHLIRFLEHSVSERLLKREHSDLLMVQSTPEELLTAMMDFTPEQTDKWINRDDL